MRLGADSIFVELAGEAFELRPSLRACMRLVRRHQLNGLLSAVQDFNFTVIADVFGEAGIKPSLLQREIAATGLGVVRNRLTGPLSEFALAVAGIDPYDAKPAPATPGESLSPSEMHTRLFEIATGWLGWTPEEAWNATPAEIIASKNGRTDLITDILKAVFGSSDQAAQAVPQYTEALLDQIERDGRDPAFDRAGLRALKGKERAL
ncbi:hypothetical protein JHC09_09600 [Devosia sp. MC532]|uniref:hypothetical protein n=1 Tax=Devosia sp. MC532 TaxID=2799788 RepID=UPI0018F33C35|nr:hypothetical protein [Devosia sp. MC532]MBJ7578141.1 hypothetical protein [Devosia sp. MC532]